LATSTSIITLGAIQNLTIRENLLQCYRAYDAHHMIILNDSPIFVSSFGSACSVTDLYIISRDLAFVTNVVTESDARGSEWRPRCNWPPAIHSAWTVESL